jgi:hypothetical protein
MMGAVSANEVQKLEVRESELVLTTDVKRRTK